MRINKYFIAGKEDATEVDVWNRLYEDNIISLINSSLTWNKISLLLLELNYIQNEPLKIIKTNLSKKD